MYVLQSGTVNGQHGFIAEVYTNGALFHSDTGAKFTIKSADKFKTDPEVEDGPFDPSRASGLFEPLE